MELRNGKTALTSQDFIYLQDTSLVPRLPLVIFQVWHINIFQFPTSAGSIQTDVHVVVDNHDIISLKLYQLTVQRSAEEEEEVTIPRVDNIDMFQGKNHPISINLFNKDVIVD